MKRLSLLFMLLLNTLGMTLFAQETTDQMSPDGSYYYPQAFEKTDEYGGNDLWMHLGLKDSDGVQITDVANYTMAIYVDDVCRVVASEVNGTFSAHLLYAPTGKTIKVRLYDTSTKVEYEFGQTFTVPSGTASIGTQPSTPEMLTFVPFEGISNSDVIIVGVDETKSIPVTFEPANHTPLVNYELSYSAGNYVRYFTVDENGNITGVAPTSGTLEATVIMTNTKSGSNISRTNIPVQVTLAVQGIELKEGFEEIVLYPDGEVNLGDYYLITPTTATNQNVTAVIPADGAAVAEVRTADTFVGYIVKGLAVGETSVTVTTEDGGKTVTIPIRVLQAVTGIAKPDNAPQGTVVVPVGTVLDSSILPYTILPEDASIKDVVYSVSNTGTTEAVSLSKEEATMGLPVAIAAGTATVTIASVENVQYFISYEVQVVEAVTDITLAAENQTIWTNTDVLVYSTSSNNNTEDNWFTLTPADVEHIDITFTNEDGSALTDRENIYAQNVNTGIMVIATASGVYKMTIATNHGFNTSAGKEISKTITVTVNQEVDNITGPNGEAGPIAITVNVGEDITDKLAYIITPDNATDKTVRYEVGDPTIVSVSDDGRVKALKAGSTSVKIYPNGTTGNNVILHLQYDVTVVEALTGINALVTEEVIYINGPVQESYFNEGTHFAFVPATTSQKDVEVTCSNEILYFDTMNGSDPVSIYVGANSYGETTVTITSVDNPELSCSIKVIVKAYPESFTTETKELTVFVDKATAMPEWTPSALNPADKQPIPEAYIEYNEENLWFTAIPVPDNNASLHDPIAFSDDNSQLAGLVPGSYYVKAQYNDGDYSVSSAENELLIRVRTPLNMQGGWNWIAFSDDFVSPTGATAETTQYLSGDMAQSIVEIRSENEIGINDTNWGWFGELSPTTNFNMYQAYKVRLEEGTYEPFAWGKDVDDNYDMNDIEMEHEFSLKEGWNWIGFNNFRSVDLSNYLRSDFAANTRIISQSGFSVYSDENGWSGSLQTLEPATGYLLYIPAGGSTTVTAEALQMMDPPVFDFKAEPQAVAKRHEEKIWNYNLRQYANNMNIVAVGDGDVAANPEKYSFGAFVGDECRGEGIFNKGYWFITLNGNGGETVSFRLYNKVTGEYTVVDNTMEFKMMAGTLSNPIAMVTRTTPTGIDAAVLADGIALYDNRIHFGALVEGTARVCDMSGRIVATHSVADGELNISSLSRGTYIVNVVADGAVVASKKVIK